MISYLTGGSTTAATQNLVVAELDRKLGLLFSGKTPLCRKVGGGFEGDVLPPLYGNPFYFVNSQAADKLLGVTSYNHAAFTAIANAAAIDSYDTENNLALCSFASPADTLNCSLQAHTVENGGVTYWLKPTTGTQARSERIRRYDVAEIIIDGLATVTIEKEWNKFNFFRLHNVSTEPVTVIFEGDATYQLAAFEIQALRRTGVGGTYQADYAYLWEVNAADPRFWRMSGTYHANNAVSFQVLFDWINEHVQPQPNDFGFRFDPDVQQAPTGYNFGDPSDESTRLFDLMKHEGSLLVVDRTTPAATTFTPLVFEGFDSLSSKLGQSGILMAQSGQLTAPGLDVDLVCLSTNLLRDQAATHSITALPHYIDFNFSFAAIPGAAPILSQTVAGTVSAIVSDSSGVISTESASQESLIATASANEINQLDTLRSVKNYWGFSDQITPRLSSAGWVFDISREIDFARPGGRAWFAANPDQTGTHSQRSYSFDGVSMTVREVMLFGLSAAMTGFPRDGSVWLSPRSPRYQTTLFRDESTRLSGDTVSGYKSGAFFAKGNGLDFGAQAVEGLSQPIQILELYPHATNSNAITDNQVSGHEFLVEPDGVGLFLDNYQVAGWYELNRADLLGAALVKQNADGTRGAKFRDRQLHFPHIIESYNHIAWLINSAATCFPLQIWDIYPELESNELGFMVGGADSGIRPKNQFAKIEAGSAAWSRADAIGIEVRNEAWFAALPTPDEVKAWRYQVSDVIDSQVAVPAGSWYLDVSLTRSLIADSLQEVIPIPGQPIDAGLDGNLIPDIANADSYRWLRVADVQSASDDLGLTFSFATQGEALKVDSFAALNPSILYHQPFSWVQRYGPFDSEAQANLFDPLTSIPAHRLILLDEYRFTHFNDSFKRLVPADVLDVQFLRTSDGIARDKGLTDIEFQRAFSGDFELEIQTSKPNAARSSEAGEVTRWAYLYYGALDNASHVLKQDKTYFHRLDNANADKAVRDITVNYGDNGKPLVKVDQNLGLSSGQEVTGSLVVEASAGREQEVVVIDQRTLDIA